MSFRVHIGNLPQWVTADDIRQWLAAEDIVASSVKVIYNHDTQQSKGFAFLEVSTEEAMQDIIRRFDRAPLEDKVLSAEPAKPAATARQAKTNPPAKRNFGEKRVGLSAEERVVKPFGGREFTPDFEIIFDPDLTATQVSVVFTALADYYRGCHGVGLSAEFESEEADVRVPTYV